MKEAPAAPRPAVRPPATDHALLLRETNHRCVNDLQLVVSLLALQSRRARSDEARAALNDAAERVAVLARARAAISERLVPDLPAALEQVCEALRVQAEPRGIAIALKVERPADGLSPERITALALVANELMTNAIKHAFKEGGAGRITVAVDRSGSGDVIVVVDDDGLPFPEATLPGGGGLGLELARRLMASIDGLLIGPTSLGKRFELRARRDAGRTRA